MTYEEWRSFRDKNNSYKMAKYHSMTPEQKEKYRNYQREKQQLYSFTKKYKQHEV
jgi:retron-type reverse transcriptase